MRGLLPHLQRRGDLVKRVITVADLRLDRERLGRYTQRLRRKDADQATTEPWFELGIRDRIEALEKKIAAAK
jgi:hypothetical protein